MKSMSEFMQESSYLVERQQGWFRVGWFREVHHERYQRALIFTVNYFLTAELGHPCSASLAFPWEKVRVENGKKRSVIVIYLVGFYLGVV